MIKVFGASRLLSEKMFIDWSGASLLFILNIAERSSAVKMPVNSTLGHSKLPDRLEVAFIWFFRNHFDELRPLARVRSARRLPRRDAIYPATVAKDFLRLVGRVRVIHVAWLEHLEVEFESAINWPSGARPVRQRISPIELRLTIRNHSELFIGCLGRNLNHDFAR